MHRRRFLSASVAALAAVASAERSAVAAILGSSGAVAGDVDALTGDGREITLSRASVSELGDSLRGDLLLPGHAAYEEARRVLNPSIDKHPALIVQPVGVADVMSAVDFARESSLLVAVKCGGHSPSGKSTCNGGMMIDLSRLRGVSVDPEARTATVAGGCWLGDLDHETLAFGLVTTAGTVSHTGVGGLTLGGGFGRLARRFGLALDNVRAVELVTADGRFVRASPDENPDLYWGVRGGGGNFGVATSFEFQLHPMDRTVIAGDLVFPLEEARQVMNVYAEYCASAPDEIYVDGGLFSRPGGSSGTFLHVCYSGDPQLADRLIAPLRKAGTVIADTIGPMDYEAAQRSGDIADPRARGSWLKSGFVPELKPAMLDVLVDGFEPHPERGLFAGFQHAGGAIGLVPDDATAFAHRYVLHDSLFILDWAMGTDPAPHIAYLRDYFGTYEPYTEGFYTNDITVDDTQQRVDRNYRGNYERLVALKNRYDPSNLFRLNANIQPSGA